LFLLCLTGFPLLWFASSFAFSRLNFPLHCLLTIESRLWNGPLSTIESWDTLCSFVLAQLSATDIALVVSPFTLKNTGKPLSFWWLPSHAEKVALILVLFIVERPGRHPSWRSHGFSFSNTSVRDELLCLIISPFSAILNFKYLVLWRKTCDDTCLSNLCPQFLIVQVYNFRLS
jgi:hypothetical protein